MLNSEEGPIPTWAPPHFGDEGAQVGMGPSSLSR